MFLSLVSVIGLGVIKPRSAILFILLSGEADLLEVVYFGKAVHTQLGLSA